MSFQLDEVKSALEFAEVVQVQADAFDSPISVSSQLFYPVLGSLPTARLDAVKGLIARQWYRHSIDEASHWLKVTDLTTGKVVGGACWRIVKHSEKPGTIDPFWLPEGNKREFAKMVFSQWAAIKGPERGPHVAIQVVFTHPDYRRHGIGNMLMEWGTKEADKLGLDSYVEGSQTGVPLYLRHGFEALGTVEVKPEIEGKSEEWKELEATLVETLTILRRPSKVIT